MKLNRDRLFVLFIGGIIGVFAMSIAGGSDIMQFYKCFLIIIGSIWYVTGEDKV